MGWDGMGAGEMNNNTKYKKNEIQTAKRHNKTTHTHTLNELFIVVIFE